MLAHFSRWLEREVVAASEFTAAQLDDFVAARQTAGYRRWVTGRSLRMMLGYLREVCAIPPEEPGEVECPVEKLLERYRVYLRRERWLAECTVRLRIDFARRASLGAAR